MKWFVLLLILCNGALWYFGKAVSPASSSAAHPGGSLPRVATLKAPADSASSLASVEFSEPEQSAAPVDSFESEKPGEPVQPAGPEEPAEPSPALHCVRLGWFESEADARAAVEGVSVNGGQIAVERIERPRPPLHWVLIPPQPPAQAREAFREIQSRGIDSYLVTEGENSYAISLGLFESRESAESVLEEKKRQNLNAILAIFPRNQISYALVFEAGRFRSPEQVKAAETDYGENFDLVEIRPCEGVATPEKNP